MARVRFQMFLDEDQKEDLEIIHKDSNIAIAELIRRAIDKYLAEYKKINKISAEELAMEKLLSVAGTCEGGPEDLADNHDKYLYRTSEK